MSVDKLVDKYGSKLGKGEFDVDTPELYGDLLDTQQISSELEFKYRDTIEMLLNMVEHGHNPHNFYDMNIINNAKRLIKEK